jgi:amino acid transporter
MYVLLCGGPFGTEEIVPSAGPGLAIIVLTLMAVFWAIPYALIIAELVTKMPVEGGIYQWFRASLPPFWSFQFSYLEWLTWVMDAALYPPLVAAYLTRMIFALMGTQGAEPSHLFDWGICLVVVWGCMWLNIRGIKAVGGTSIGMAILQITPVVVLIALGWRYLNFSNLSPMVTEEASFWPALRIACVWGLWNYSGYGALAAASEEIVEPEKTYPRTLATFLPISVIVYVLPLVVALGVTPNWQEWGTGHLSNVAMALGGAGLLIAISVAAQSSNIGLFNSEQLVISRYPYAMARDGILPGILAKLHPRYATPHLMLIIQGIIYSLLTFFFEFDYLLDLSTWISLPIYLLTFATPIILRLKRPDLRGRFEIPGGWPVLILCAAVPSVIALFVLVTIGLNELLVGLGFLAVGPLLYVWSRWHLRRYGAASDSQG